MSNFGNVVNKSLQRALDQRRFALKLYRGLRRAHDRLPADMRGIGNEYVRNEFKLHKDADPKYLRGFYAQWMDYLTHLANVKDFNSPGKDMDPEDFNDEQAEKMVEFRDELDAFKADFERLYTKNDEETKEN